MAGDGQYEVGFGKPPKHSQFKAGQSGCPTGGKKKPAKPGEVIARALAKKRRVVLDGAAVKMTALELMVEQLTRRAMKGDLPAIKILLTEATLLAQQEGPEEPPMSEHELKLLTELLTAAQGGDA